MAVDQISYSPSVAFYQPNGLRLKFVKARNCITIKLDQNRELEFVMEVLYFFGGPHGRIADMPLKTLISNETFLNPTKKKKNNNKIIVYLIIIIICNIATC